jgi:hydrogenase/urease accessory protein HupE
MNKEKLVLWTKRLVGFLAIGLWLSIIYEISRMSVPFMEQAPYCMGTTMLIFGLLTVMHKSLDYWSKKSR